MKKLSKPRAEWDIPWPDCEEPLGQGSAEATLSPSPRKHVEVLMANGKPAPRRRIGF